jgi:hypothetical protein
MLPFEVQAKVQVLLLIEENHLIQGEGEGEGEGEEWEAQEDAGGLLNYWVFESD